MGRKPNHGPSFFKILIGEEFADKLRIPPAFVTSNLAGQLPAKALIKAQNDSRAWTVEVKKTGDKNHYSFIRRGWRKFVEDCGLQAGDFVVFKLISNSVFEIVRYGPDGCEKEVMINPVSEQIKENTAKARATRSIKSEEAPAQASSGDSLPTNHPRRGVVNFPFAVTDRVTIKGNNRTPQRLVGREAIVTTRCLHGWYAVKTLDNPESVKLQYSSLVKVSDDPSSSKPSTGPNARRSSRIVAEASGSRKQTEYPSFDAVIGKVVISNYYRSRLTLPMAFARGTGMATKRAVVLKNEEGRVWPVDIRTYPSSRGRIDLSGGWPAFLKENNLVLGDSCVFKFIPSAGNVIDVVVQKGRRRYGPDGCEKEVMINPVSEQIKENTAKARATRSIKSEEAPARNLSLSSPEASSGDSLPTNHPGRGVVNFPFAVTDRVTIKGNNRTPQRLVGREAIVTTRCLHGWYAVKTLDNPESVKLQYSSLVKVSDDPSSSKPSTGPNARRSSRIVAEASGSRKQTEYPSFYAVIGKVVISNYYRSRLTLPMAFGRGTGMATKRAVVLKNEEGGVWPVDIRTYPSSRGRIDLSGGWPAFLKENNIVLGDSCVFKFIPSAGNVIDVVVQKGRRR